MPLQAGTRLGAFTIQSPLGAGGMGEVYRARDAKLGRDVAVKVLPASVSDPDRLARFAREAQLVASLNHPHIAHVYGIEDADGIRALVKELVEGIRPPPRDGTSKNVDRDAPRNGGGVSCSTRRSR